MRKGIINKIIAENSNAVLVKNKYKVLKGMIKRMYPNNYEKLPSEVWENIIFDIVAGNRDWQKLTEKFDKKTKKIKSNEWIENNYQTL